MDTDNKTIVLAADTDIKAEGLTSIKGVAYGGGSIRQAWSDTEIVVDLDGMQFSQQVPLLLSHENHPDARLGYVVANVAEGKLEITGGIDTNDDAGKSIAEKGKRLAWQLSIGADILKAESVEEGSVVVNGREFAAPIVVVRSSRLREVSVVAVGADCETVLSVAAAANLRIAPAIAVVEAQKEQEVQTHNKENKMDDKTPATDNTAAINEAVKAARAEMGAVLAITADYPEIQQKAIAAGWTKEHAQDVVDAAKAVAAKHPAAPANIIVKEEPTVDAKAIEAALSLQAGIAPEVVAKSCGEKAVDVADTKLNGFGLRDAIVAVAKIEGKDIGYGFGTAAIKAGLSTVSLPGILSNVANKAAMKAYTEQPGVAEKLCSAASLADFKEASRYRMTSIGDLEIVPDGGELKHAGAVEEKATNRLDTYGKMFSLSRQMIINDDLGEFVRIPAMMGAKAKRKVEEVFFARLLSNPTMEDNKALFHTAHKNYVSTGTALSKDSLEAAIASFEKQTDIDGKPIAVSPSFLLVPSELKAKAQALVNSQYLVGGSTAAPELNVVSQYGLSVISSPYLSNASFGGYSATAWYLWAAPSMVDTFEIGYLQGKRVPTVETADVDFAQLGIQYRVFFDFGVREQDFRGVFKNVGA